MITKYLLTTIILLACAITAHASSNAQVSSDTQVSSDAQVSSEKPLDLSPEEVIWLDSSGVIRTTGNPNWLPFEAFGPQQEHMGVIPKYLELFAQQTQVSFQSIPSSSWTNAIEMARSGQVDILSSDHDNQLLTPTHRFTNPYLIQPLFVFSHTQGGAAIDDLTLVSEQRIGVIKNQGYGWKLKDAYPNISFIEIDSIELALNQSRDKELDYFISTNAFSNFYMQQLGIDNLHIQGQLPINLELAFAVRSDWPELVSILNKQIELIPRGERYSIIEQWLLANAGLVTDARWQQAIIRSALVGCALLAGIAALIYMRQKKNRKREDRYRKALAAVNAGEIEYSHARGYLHVSAPLMARLGLTSTQKSSVLKDLLGHVSADDRDNLEKAILQAGASSDSENSVDITFQVLSPKGLFWLRLRADIHLTKRDRQLAGTLEDITRLKESQQLLAIEREKLAEHEEFLNSVLNNIPDMVSVKDDQGRYTFANTAYCRFTGTTVDELIGTTGGEHFCETSSQFMYEKEHEVKATRKVLRYEADYPSTSGVFFNFDTIKAPLTNRDQQLLGVLTVARDITERQQLLDELYQFKLFAEGSPTYLGMCNTDGEFVYVNWAITKLFKGPNGREEDIIGTAFINYYSKQSQALIKEVITPEVIETNSWEGELELINHHGEAVPTQQAIQVIHDKRGNIRFSCAIAVDISDEKRIQAELAAAREKAEEANRSKSMFLANMSHEIRTPLNPIIGFSQLLSTKSTLDPETREQIKIIESAGKRLLGLINDVLDLSKIEAGKLSLTPAPFDLHAELIDLCQLMQPRAVEKNLMLETNIQLGEHHMVMGDRVKISQVLLNLMGNAVKFTAQGRIGLNARWQNHKTVTIEIYDTGPGVSGDELIELFQPFNQGRSGALLGGTGLGLVLSKHLIELMGGTLEFVNRAEPDPGATVILNIPLQTTTLPRSPEEDAAFRYAQLEKGSHLTVLVAEDDPASQNLLSGYLANIGCSHVLQANDGVESLELLSENKVDIIFTDIRMVGMGGIELLEHLRANSSLKNIPVIAVTASTLEHEQEDLLNRGFNGFIGKPVDLTLVNQELNKHLAPKWQDVETLSIDSDQTSLDDVSAVYLNEAEQHQAEAIVTAIESGDIDSAIDLLKEWQHSTRLNSLYQNLRQSLDRYDLQSAESILKSINTGQTTEETSHE